MSNGYKRCRCRDPETGRALEGQCPKLRRANGSWNPGHGTWYGKAELPAAPNGDRVILKAGGFRTEDDMEAWFADATRLVSIPDPAQAGIRSGWRSSPSSRSRGRRRRPSPTTRTSGAATGTGAAFSAGTTGEFLLAWLEERKADLGRGTWRQYESHVRRVFLPVFGDIPLDKLRPAHVARAFDAIDAENERIVAARLSPDPKVRASVRGKRTTGPATKQRIRATLRSALSDAADPQRGLITVNAAKLLRLEPGKRPKARVWTDERVAAWRAEYEKRVQGITWARARFWAYKDPAFKPSPVMVWTPEQTGAFLDAVANTRLYALWHLIAYRGLRRGEACGLRWIDTDLDAGRINIAKQLVVLGWEVEEGAPKTEASDAAVALDQETVRVLRAWRKAQLAERLSWGKAWTDSGRVFTQEDGKALHPDVVSNTFELAAFEAGLPPIRLHDLRHGAASLAFAGGADMKDIQAMLRHSSVAITADTYTSVLPEVAAEVAEKVAAVVPRRAVSGGSSETAGPPSVPHRPRGRGSVGPVR